MCSSDLPDAGLIPKSGTPERSETMRWLIFLTNTVQSAYMRFFYPQRHTTDPNGADQVVAAAVKELTDLRGYVSAHLRGPFLQGDRFSIADSYLAMLSSWGAEIDGAGSWWADPKLAAHYDSVLARPGCRQALEQEGGSLSAG